MGKAIRIPDPVAERIDREAERQDVARGVVVREWMEKADKFDKLEVGV
jgi:predicted DNA-binding protein